MDRSPNQAVSVPGIPHARRLQGTAMPCKCTAIFVQTNPTPARVTLCVGRVRQGPYRTAVQYSCTAALQCHSVKQLPHVVYMSVLSQTAVHLKCLAAQYSQLQGVAEATVCSSHTKTQSIKNIPPPYSNPCDCCKIHVSMHHS